MAAGPRELGLTELTDHREIYDILLGYALRGVRVQIVLRACLVAFVILVVLIVPPADDRLPCYLIAAAYTLWSLAVALLARDGGERAARLVWLALFVDAIALAVLALIASSSNEVSWTSDVLLNGFFLIPMLAATQLRPWVGTVVLAPTVLVYLGASIAARASNSEPWSSVLLRTGVLAALAVGAILLTRVQRARVEAIGALAVERSQLLDETLQIEARERRELAERVHDGALQYVLAARQELEDAREYNDPASFDRVEQALRESSQLLRSIMTELHPAVLEQSGVPAALRELSRTVAARGEFTVDLDLDGLAAGRAHTRRSGAVRERARIADQRGQACGGHARAGAVDARRRHGSTGGRRRRPRDRTRCIGATARGGPHRRGFAAGPARRRRRPVAPGARSGRRYRRSGRDPGARVAASGCVHASGRDRRGPGPSSVLAQRRALLAASGTMMAIVPPTARLVMASAACTESAAGIVKGTATASAMPSRASAA